jgi:hypothetical protein
MILPACISLDEGDVDVETTFVKWATENAGQVTLLVLAGLLLTRPIVRIFVERIRSIEWGKFKAYFGPADNIRGVPSRKRH